MSDGLVLQVTRPGGASHQVSGWENIEVTLRCEGFPNNFAVSLTDPDVSNKGGVVAAAGDECQVMLGNDLVITGYIDRDGNAGDANGHTLSAVGRGRCQDLVDCSAEWEDGKIVEGDALSIASKLASAYKNLSVVLADGASAGPVVPGWALNYGETAAAIIQRVAQNAGLLAYEDPQGRLVLSGIGTREAKGGLVYGQNVESWSVTNSADQCYSDIVCANHSIAVLDVGGPSFFDRETDTNVKRHRQLDIVLEDLAQGDAQDFTIKKAKWQIARRAGRATSVSITTDSWRDSDKKLWQPNTLVKVDVPGLRLDDKQLCISEVTFRRGQDGTHADLVLLPKAAFLLEPIALFPAPRDVVRS